MGGVTCLLLLLWAGVTVSTMLDLQKRIIGGRDCKKDERLYHVQIQDQDGIFICGGSLISDRWILTAAHCWEDNLKVVVGVHPGPGTNQSIEISVKYTDHDIMLLKLPNPSRITPVKLPDCTKTLKPKDKVHIAGHGDKKGKLGEKKNEWGYSPTLQCADTEVVQCSPYKNMHTFCGMIGGVDTCPGDAGGGVVYDGKIYGVHIRSGKHVGETESVFMDVCKYMDWIRVITKSPSTILVTT